MRAEDSGIAGNRAGAGEIPCYDCLLERLTTIYKISKLSFVSSYIHLIIRVLERKLANKLPVKLLLNINKPYLHLITMSIET